MKKKTWIGLCLTAALCLPLVGCAGDKTGEDITPGTTTNPTAQTTPTTTPTATPDPTDDVLGGDADRGETNTDAANGGNNVSGTPVGDDVGTQRSVTRGATNNIGTGRTDDSALERMGDGIKDTLDDMGNGARRMAQDAKRTME